jgi:hypothetical protein
MASDIFRATVTRSETEGVYVTVPGMDLGGEYGPCDPLPTVIHAPGDRVLVGTLADLSGQVVILRTMP